MILQVSWLIFFIYSVNAKCDSGNYSVTDKTIIVTGGARGIGYAIANNFLAAGAKTVIIVDRNATSGTAAVQTLKSKYGCKKAVFYRCNVYKDLDCFDRIVARYKKVGILVNSAGVLNEYTVFDMVLTNVAGLITFAFKFRDFNRIDRNGPGGTIINLSSRASYTIYPVMPAYTATKYAIRGFSVDLGHDYNCRKTGIRVIAMCPDFTRTEMTRVLKVEKDQAEIARKLVENSKSQSADDVGKATLAVYKQARTGTCWTVSGGKYFMSPESEYISTKTLDSF